jgi:DNA-binding NarL/FixJ family response regulator
MKGFTAPEIAEKLHLSKHHVMNIYTGRSWRDLLGVNGNPTLEELRASKPTKRRASPNRILTDAMIDDILQSRMNGDSAKTIAARMGLAMGTVSPVFCGLAFTERLGVDGNPTFEELRANHAPKPQAKLTEDDIIEIRDLLARGFTGKSIAAKYGVSPPTVSLIRSGKR